MEENREPNSGDKRDPNGKLSGGVKIRSFSVNKIKSKMEETKPNT